MSCECGVASLRATLAHPAELRLRSEKSQRGSQATGGTKTAERIAAICCRRAAILFFLLFFPSSVSNCSGSSDRAANGGRRGRRRRARVFFSEEQIQLESETWRNHHNAASPGRRSPPALSPQSSVGSGFSLCEGQPGAAPRPRAGGDRGRRIKEQIRSRVGGSRRRLKPESVRGEVS